MAFFEVAALVGIVEGGTAWMSKRVTMSALCIICSTFVVRLLDAYKTQDSVKDRELLLSALKCGKNQRYTTFAFSLN